jgi:transposase
MPDDCITVQLGLPGLVVEGSRQERDTLIVSVRYWGMSRPCPKCGLATGHVHQYHRQYKSHRPLWGRAVILEIRKRRFRCGACGRVFMEADDVCGWRRRSTRVFRMAVAEACRVSTVKAVATSLQVSEALVRRAFAEMAPRMMGEPTDPPDVVGLDEVWFGARMGCFTVLYAPEAHRVQGLRLGRTQASAEALLESRTDWARLKAVVIDMAEPYRQAVQYACPQAVIVADKFHVLSRVLLSLGKVISRVQSTADKEDAKVLRHRRLFTAPSARLSASECHERDRLLARYPELARAWQTTQAFRAIYGLQSRAEAALALDDWWTRVQRCGPREFRGLYHVMGHWREEILNYFTYRVTNGFAEGKNNRIKGIIRSGYGYRNLANLTQRIMLTNCSEPAAGEGYSPHFLT